VEFLIDKSQVTECYYGTSLMELNFYKIKFCVEFDFFENQVLKEWYSAASYFSNSAILLNILQKMLFRHFALKLTLISLIYYFHFSLYRKPNRQIFSCIALRPRVCD